MSDPRDSYPLPPSPADRERLLAAAVATPEANTPAAAWEAILPFVAEPVDALIKDGQLSLERIVNDVGEIYVLRVQLAGCAGSVWEHNERIGDKWSSLADPAADIASPTMLPSASVFTGADGNPAAALHVRVRDRSHIAELIEIAAEPLNLKGGAREK